MNIRFDLAWILQINYLILRKNQNCVHIVAVPTTQKIS